MKSILTNAGRIVYALIMLVFGSFHLMNGPKMVGMVPGFIPGGVIIVYLTGVALILAGVAIIIKKKMGLAAMLLGIFLLLTALTVHLPGGEASMPMLLKDLALAGAAFYISGNAED
jgi:putative oxidoreductase